MSEKVENSNDEKEDNELANMMKQRIIENIKLLRKQNKVNLKKNIN